MNGLAKIQRGRASRPPRLLVYGLEGLGKSSFAAQAPRPIFIQTEDGLDSIDCERFPLANSYEQVIDALQELVREDHSYQSVVLDSLDWAERLIWDRVCADFGVKSIERADGGYARGYTHALTYWREIIRLLAELRDHRGMAVILVAHSKVERVEDPTTPAYDRYSPRLHKHACALLTEWADAVLFAHWRYRIQSDDAGFGRERRIAVSLGALGDDRVLRCVGSPAWVAKNRFDLPPEIPLSWGAVMAGLQGANSLDGSAIAQTTS
ncbi:MAG: ATP-binding protein [Pirellulales bacterium]